MNPSDFNHKQYSRNFKQYLESNTNGTVGGGTVESRVELLQHFLPVKRRIFEIGSGGGIDARLLKKVGYKVIASDYVEQFVNGLRESGLDAIPFDAKNQEIPTSADCIYANAVFVHFDSHEFSNFLVHAKEKLTHEKIIFLTVLAGEGYERSARSRSFERDFYYYTEESLSELVHAVGYKVLFMKDIDGKWIQAVIAVA